MSVQFAVLTNWATIVLQREVRAGGLNINITRVWYPRSDTRKVIRKRNHTHGYCTRNVPSACVQSDAA